MNHHSLKYLSVLAGIAGILSVNIALADIQQLTTPTPGPSVSPTVSSVTKPWPIGCYDFTANLKAGTKGVAIRHLQYFLIKEGFDIPSQEFGVFGNITVSAVNAFQQKYASEILVPAGLMQGNGFVGKGTRAKLNSLYSCDVVPFTEVIQSYTINAAPTPTPTPVIAAHFGVQNISLDPTGVTVTFCNKGIVDLPTAPFRIRLNGINRDFEVTNARKAGICETDSIPYGTWGLIYDVGSTFTAIGLIDPNGYYKTSGVTFPITATTTLSVPALPGAHLSVRSVLIKTAGIQSTLCNLGSADLTSFPVRVTVNGTSKDFDMSAAYKKGVCTAVTWTYDNFGISYTPNTNYSVTVTTDPNNVIPEVNEFDNTATAIGTP